MNSLSQVKYKSFTRIRREEEEGKKFLGVKDYAAAWEKLFTTGGKRPGSLCAVPLKPIYKPTKKISHGDGQESFIPKPKPNVYYNKPGFEDAAYFFDYVDDVLRKDVIAKFKEIWEKAKKTPADPALKDPYALQTRMNFFYNSGGASKVTYNYKKETNEKRLASTLKIFEPQIDPDLMLDGVKVPQLTTIFKEFGISFNPGLMGWQKKKLDEYDFNGDGTLDAEEFLFMLIFENKNKLNDPKLFKDLCKSTIDPIFDYLDCDSDGLITAEGIWVGLKELIRQDVASYNIYNCLSPKSGLPVRTSAPGDVILKNSEEAEGYLNIDEWRKAILLGFWDRQVSNNEILTDDSNNQKELRWIGNNMDRRCPSGY